MPSTEQVVAAGCHGALVWAITNQRLIIAHESAIPAAIPSSDRIAELVLEGFNKHEIAAMYGINARELYPPTPKRR